MLLCFEIVLFCGVFICVFVEVVFLFVVVCDFEC